MAKKDRTLYVLKYLWKDTDEDHPATVSDILAALEAENIKVERHALMSDSVRQCRPSPQTDRRRKAQSTAVSWRQAEPVQAALFLIFSFLPPIIVLFVKLRC